mmetsp:Transcript_28813/g.63473  ORF Transcript_28813/g.63473 Transcript_28813/m.63473 type:complete len:471 (-) Transcript_28813:1558-2970(-)|eukprot:CAMPEP_0202906382 /NCGR_PEP_ID=MMETSP1392-20130828/38691_1 /ASSEMBLY_ACC=CAM_ASM_000868 /TAXON_ID=225041 /ORGANISM="Chlamydomonas chlamydogama, Strain SAG 11-48b" /LENGTH=470 /DNA_ID=CAMNT_0049594871 /DNA_START=146 /DNA_END=1558 /DNA_ORIENTATION=-
MKRGYEFVNENPRSSTPRAASGRFARPPLGKSTAKRYKQCTLRMFFDTPVAGVQQAETPASLACKAAAREEWPSAAQRQLEHFTLDTPVAGIPDVEGGKLQEVPSNASTELHYEVDDFKLFSQPDYVRLSSQTQEYDDPAECMPEQEDGLELLGTQETNDKAPRIAVFEHASEKLPTPGPTPTQLAPISVPVHHVLGHDDEHANHPTQPVQAVSLHHEEPAVTPELVVASSLPAAANGQASVGEGPANYFPIFRPLKQRKFLVIVRHGESEYNKAVIESKGFGDPMIFDPSLTPKGQQQASGLQGKLATMLAKHGNPLWVVSPLTRAIQTFLRACPALDNSGASSSSSAPPSAGLNIEVQRLIAEFVVTAGDVGRPTSLLTKDFPQLASQLVTLPEQWWYQDKGKPNCAIKKVIQSFEPSDLRKKRVEEFTRWLNTRQEEFIVLIGHCSFWYSFTKTKRLANCEMECMYW